jgi:hypothetical protein
MAIILRFAAIDHAAPELPSVVDLDVLNLRNVVGRVAPDLRSIVDRVVLDLPTEKKEARFLPKRTNLALEKTMRTKR